MTTPYAEPEVPDEPIVLVDIMPSLTLEEQVKHQQVKLVSMAATRSRLYRERAELAVIADTARTELLQTDAALAMVGDRASRLTDLQEKQKARLDDIEQILESIKPADIKGDATAKLDGIKKRLKDPIHNEKGRAATRP